MLQNHYRDNRNLSFPYSTYSSWLENISLVKPKALAPGANGFKFINGSAWLNKITFPLTREQFCKDARIVLPRDKRKIYLNLTQEILSLSLMVNLNILGEVVSLLTN